MAIDEDARQARIRYWKSRIDDGAYAGKLTVLIQHLDAEIKTEILDPEDKIELRNYWVKKHSALRPEQEEN